MPRQKKPNARNLAKTVKAIKEATANDPVAQKRACIAFIDKYKGKHSFINRMQRLRARDPEWTPSKSQRKIIFAVMSSLAETKKSNPGDRVINRTQKRMAHLPDSLQDPASL